MQGYALRATEFLLDIFAAPLNPRCTYNMMEGHFQQMLLFAMLASVLCSEGSIESGVEEIELNVEKIASIGNTDVLLSTISRLALALNKCGVDVRGITELQRVMLPGDSNAKCMDGTTAGYYIRKKSGSKRWLLFLDGGHYCFDKRSCRSRSDNTPNMTSSTYWPLTKEGSGILSWNPEENPFLYSANVVYVPYCSSDAFAGNNTKNGMYFMGANIVEEVVKDLYNHDLQQGEKLFFAGSSAGATGVLLNIDRVADTLARDAPGLDVYGIVDSGWFIDPEQLHNTECTSTLNCPPAEAVKKGFRLWKPEVPKRCRRAYPAEPWRCFFGYRVYPYIKSPLFVITYLYDEAQVVASMGGFSGYQQAQQDTHAKRNTQSATYMRELARLMNHTLSNVSAVFAPSCLDHELLLNSKWHSISINEVTLFEALRCWEGSQEMTNRPRQEPPSPYPWTSGSFDMPQLLSLSEDFENEKANEIRHSKNKDKDERRQQRKLKSRQKQRAYKNRHRRLQRMRRSVDEDDEILANALRSNSLNSLADERHEQCVYKLYDSCTTPNCNLHCPSYINIFGLASSNGGNYDQSDSSEADGAYNAGLEDIENYIDDPETLKEVIARQR
ncbi:palmitoleoyl-protein carboxylesterase NOTUM-like isoform X2 [Watersipora subatra]|uniref:palmitoleoyl-protein carboxylesterase NOTUM-like isoform X2 n=1 Tax=Watersipora subatra TaxID=2589382 RepID=UPI00355C58C2